MKKRFLNKNSNFNFLSCIKFAISLIKLFKYCSSFFSFGKLGNLECVHCVFKLSKSRMSIVKMCTDSFLIGKYLVNLKDRDLKVQILQNVTHFKGNKFSKPLFYFGQTLSQHQNSLQILILSS